MKSQKKLEKKKPIDTRLSYSSATLLSNCTQKYYHHKIANTPRDKDAEEDFHAFNVGKAFHCILEKTKHGDEPSEELVKWACKLYKVISEQAMIHAMVLKYYKLHKKIGLECIGTEFEISNPNFVGYVDAVLINPKTKNWWIVDLKTTARLQDTLIARLHSDTQLNLYSSFALVVSKMFKLNPKKFAGARYRATTKDKLQPRKGEKYIESVRRHFQAVDSYDIEIPVSKMDPMTAYSKHAMLHRQSLQLRSGELKPTQNFSYCDSYFKPCEFWSKCHGKTYTQLSGDLKITSTKRS